jgi:hypothetical protein
VAPTICNEGDSQDKTGESPMNLPKDSNNHRIQWMEMLATFLKILILVLEASRSFMDLFK